VKALVHHGPHQKGVGRRSRPHDYRTTRCHRAGGYHQDLWIKDIDITTGLVSATTTPMLLKLVAQGKLTPERFATHRFTFDNIMDAYDTFSRAAETKALKVVITR